MHSLVLTVADAIQLLCDGTTQISHGVEALLLALETVQEGIALRQPEPVRVIAHGVHHEARKALTREGNFPTPWALAS